jgi:hypothetical protein
VRPFDFSLCDAPCRLEVLLRLSAQLFERLSQLGKLRLGRALQLFRVLLRGRTYLRHLRFRLRPGLSRGRFRRLHYLLSVLAGQTSHFPRNGVQFSLEVLPQAGRRTVERCADLIVEGQDGLVDYKTRFPKLL